ncbi:hypothetical protein ABMA28_009880 [Loxostege sticticalis]|uniref:Major facilitator superfamily (MFS) profile domain-containing protein n=1 Tax=Loxostege sticticalis TaxID=481309 RepID=A0ABD0SFJ8_LOXSC
MIIGVFYSAYLFIYCGVSCIGQILFGYAAGWPSPVMPKLLDPDEFPRAPTPMQTNWIVSIIFIGCLIGTVISGPLSNTVGRKPCLIVGGSTASLSFLALALIKHPYSLMAFRLICGVGCSMVFGVNLVYIGEIASTEIRGMLLGSTGLFNSLGFLVVYSVGNYVPYDVINYIGMILGIVFVTGILFAPETPIYYIIRGRNEEAKATLLALGRKDDAEKVSELRLEIESNQKVKAWNTLLKVKCNRKALVITSLLHIFQQASGIGAMLAYTTMIFEISGSSITPYIATIIVGAVNLAAGFITPLFVERFGRKILLLMSTFLTGLTLLILAIYIYHYNTGNPAVLNIRWVPLPVYILYCISYSFGFGVLPATLVGEMFQLNVRSAGSAVALCISWLAAFICLSTFGYIISGSGVHVAFAIFSASCGLAFLFTIFFVPETKGKSLIEVQEMLDK